MRFLRTFLGMCAAAAIAASPARALAPASAGLPLRPGEVEEALLREALRNLRNRAGKFDIPLPAQFFERKPRRITRADLRHPDGLNVFVESGYEADLLLLLASAEVPGINVVVIPYSLNNLHIAVENGVPRAFCRYGIVVSRRGRVCHGWFDEPLPVHSGYSVGNTPARLEQTGFPLLNGAMALQATQNKVGSKLLLQGRGIPTPPGIFLIEKASSRTIERRLRRFLSEQKAGRFVVKPSDRSCGVGVRMFRGDEKSLAEAVGHIQRLQMQSSAVLVEKRIEPPPFLHEGRQMDWNLRSLVTFDEKDRPVLAGLEVRAAPKSNRPVNVYGGAVVLEAEDVLKRLKTPARQRREFLRQARKISLAAAAAVFDDVPRGVGLLGLDLIADGGLNLRVMECNSGAVGGVGSLARIREGDRKFEAAVPVLRRLAELARRHGERLRTAPPLNGTRPAAWDENRYQAWLMAGERFERLGQRRKARWSLERAVEANPRGADALALLGDLYFKARQWNRAERCYRAALMADSMDAPLFQKLADTLLEQPDRDRALRELNKWRDFFPAEPALLKALGILYAEKDRIGAAKKMFAAALRVNPRDRTAWYNLALLLRLEKRTADADVAAKRGLDPDFPDVRVLILLATLELELGREEESQVFFTRAVLLAPDLPDVWYAYGSALRGLKRQVEAQRYLLAAIKLDRNHLPSLYEMGLVSLEEEEWSEAMRCFKRILRWLPGDPQALAGLISCLVGCHSYEAAWALAVKGARQHPRNPRFAELKEDLSRLVRHLIVAPDSPVEACL